MSHPDSSALPPEQENIRDRCSHPSATFVEFAKTQGESSIPARFEEIAGRFHDRLAVKAGDRSITYGELNRRSNHVAAAILHACGESPEPVGVLCAHDAPVVAAILGVLKAGKFYLPMDAHWPRQRACHILESSQARLVITDHAHFGTSAALARNSARILNMDLLDPKLDHDHRGPAVSPQAYAYVIYTSGSTGEPKGVLQNHRNVLHQVMNNTNGLRICREDRLTGLYPYYANGGAHDIFTALLNGAALFPFDVRRWGPSSIPGWLDRETLTIYHSVRSVFRQFALSLRGGESFSSLRAISVGGENVTKFDIDLFQECFSDRVIFVNRLGSTECGRMSRYFIAKETVIDTPNVPVGYASPGYEIDVVNDSGAAPVSDRVGEIIVKSEFLSPGYWRRTDLTQERFSPDPEDGTRRLYRTGDLGRLLGDGRLEYIGRKDFEVKIGGNRIQIAEVELALAAFPGIKEVNVMARQTAAGEPQLVAYYRAERGAAPKHFELRRFLRKRLPGIMIPSVFMQLEGFPLTGNSKLDRSSLPAPSTARPVLDTVFVGPATQVERLLAKLWSETLTIDPIGIHDNFFDLGGHSLTATRLVAHVVREFHLEIPLQSLFQSPTVAAMAAVILDQQEKQLGGENLEVVLNHVESLSDEKAEQLVREDDLDGPKT